MHVEYSTTRLSCFKFDVIAEGLLLVDVLDILVDNALRGCACACACCVDVHLEALRGCASRSCVDVEVVVGLMMAVDD